MLTLPLPLPLTLTLALTLTLFLTLTLTLTSSRGCRFLWAEYKEGFWYFETIQQLRRLFLTGYVMLLSARSNTRLLAACTVTIYLPYISPRSPLYPP